MTATFEPTLLNGVETIQGQTIFVSTQVDRSRVQTEQPFKVIPYFARANRGNGEMTAGHEWSQASGLWIFIRFHPQV